MENSLEKEFENQENLNVPPVHIVYRNNDLYSTLVPKIVADMEKIGRKVVTHSFPQGTPEEEIKKYFEDETVRESLKNTELFADQTCKSQFDYDFVSKNFKKETNLDAFSSKVLGDVLIGKEVFEGKEKVRYPEELEALKNVVLKIIEQHGQPDGFYIVEDGLAAHNFDNKLFASNKIPVESVLFHNIPFENINEEVEKTLALDSNSFHEKLKNNPYYKSALALGFDKKELEEIVRATLDKNERGDTIWANFIARKIKDVLKDIVEDDKIKIVLDANDIPDEDNSYVLIDRHGEHNKFFVSKIKLPLPFSSMVDDIIKNKLLDVDFDVDEAVKKEIDMTFKK